MQTRHAGRRVRAMLPFAIIMVAAPAAAEEASLRQCLAIADVQARVACYDRIARAESQGARPEQRRGRASPAAAPRPVDPRADFGLDQAAVAAHAAEREQRVGRVEVKVAAARPFGMDSWEFGMADGSVWRLAETRHAFRAPKPGDLVDLERGALGSYLLRFGKQQAMRVRRIR